MATVLRPYQLELKADIYAAWNAGHKNILACLPTGMGKTRIFCTMATEMALGQNRFPTAICVHRKELVQQISLTLAEEGHDHNIIAPRTVILGIVGAHRRVLRRQFYDYHAPITVVSVDTLNARILKHEKWAKGIRFWITDEATHLLKNNKWGRAVGYFPNAIGLGVTATPRRLDKKGLGRHADGVFDTMVEGPGTRWGIEHGHLCRYKIAIPPSDYHHFLKAAGDSSDFTKEAMLAADHGSKIVGDVVNNYIKFANGKQSILFASAIETGKRMEKEFNARGIPAKLLTGETEDKERLDALIDFKNKLLRVLINIDLFDEGLDVPGIECVQMGRPTMSVSKYLQMIGRGLRPAEGKDHLIIIDHVGNVMRHGIPDRARQWTLDRIVKRRDTTNFLRICSNVTCNAPFDRVLIECPYCGTPAIMGAGGGGVRSLPKEVDGDLHLVDGETLRELEAKSQLEDPGHTGKRAGFAAGPGAAQSAMKNQISRIETQKELVNIIAKWAGVKRHWGYTDRQIHKAFYLQFEATISEKLSEPRAEMLAMIEELQYDLPKGHK